MPPLLHLPLPALVRDETLSPAVAAAERAVLVQLARSGESRELRWQALIDLMALEAACGDELAFERLRHELSTGELPGPLATLFRVQVTWGLVRFERLAAARRWAWVGAPLGHRDAR